MERARGKEGAGGAPGSGDRIIEFGAGQRAAISSPRRRGPDEAAAGGGAGRLDEPAATRWEVDCRERLGELLRHYYRYAVLNR